MQEKNSSKRILSAVMCRLSAVMLLLTLVSFHVISGTVAKYVTGSGTVSDNAQVASFSVEALGDDGNVSSLSLEYGSANASKSYKITITNNSEVAVRYTVSITFTSDVSGMLTAKIGDVTGSYSGNTFTWSAGELDIGENKELILTLTAGDGIIPGEDETTAHEEYTFNTRVKFEQID